MKKDFLKEFLDEMFNEPEKEWRENDNIDFDAIRDKYKHIPLEKKELLWQEVEKEILRRREISKLRKRGE